MITHNSIVFPNTIHENPVFGSFESPITVQTWLGVRGAKVRTYPAQTREITLDATLTGFSTEANFLTGRGLLDQYRDQGLAGTLVIDAITLTLCTFLGWTPRGIHFLDGSGVNGWTQFGQLKWLQIASW